MVLRVPQTLARSKSGKTAKASISRAKQASKEVLDNYFREVGKVMRENNLMEAPQCIYNLDETGISTEHAPPLRLCVQRKAILRL